MTPVTTVKMGEIRTISGAGCLQTSGIGSCVAVIMYDHEAKIGGMAHVLLPASGATHDDVPLRYLDCAIPALIDSLCAKGADRGRLVAKLVGGSHMFSLYGDAQHSIGHRNIEQAHLTLAEYSIPVIAEETGGSVGRNAQFDVETGICSVEIKL